MHLLLRDLQHKSFGVSCAADAEAAEPCGAATPLRRSLLLSCRAVIDLAVSEEMAAEPQGDASRRPTGAH